MSFALPTLLWWQWCLAALGAFLVGVSKTGIAGIGIIAVTLFPLVWSGKAAVGIALVILICADLVAIAAYPPKNVRWDIWRLLFPWAAVGVAIGAEAVKHIQNDSLIKQIIGGILLGIVVLQLYVRATRGKSIAAPPDSPLPAPSLYMTIFTGLVAGIATMIANAAGPIMVLYLLPRRLPKLEFIGTTAWFFFALNLFKVPFSFHAGMMDLSSPVAAIFLLPAAVLGGLAGKWLLPRIDQNAFEVSALILTAFASVRLLLG